MPSRTALSHLTCDLVQCGRLSLQPLIARSQPAQRTRRGAQSAIAAEKALDGDGGRLEVVGIYVNVCATALEVFPLGHLPNRRNGSGDCAALPIQALDGSHDIFVMDLEAAARFFQRFVIQLVASRLDVDVLLVGHESLLPSCTSMIRNEYKPLDAMVANRAPKASI